MAVIDQLALATFQRDSLEVRSLAQDLLRHTPDLSQLPRPLTDAPHLLAIAASLVELLAERQGQKPPAWTEAIDALPEPFFLLEAAVHMKHLRTLCENESPSPLRKRRLYAPPNFLEFV